MNSFTEGVMVYHKSTGRKCVIISVLADGRIKVRTEDDLEREYFPQELKTEEESIRELRQQMDSVPNKDFRI